VPAKAGNVKYKVDRPNLFFDLTPDNTILRVTGGRKATDPYATSMEQERRVAWIQVARCFLIFEIVKTTITFRSPWRRAAHAALAMA
jgi:hypothetical protein